MYIGTNLVNKIYLGNTEVKRIYSNTTIIYDTEPIVPPTPQIYLDFVISDDIIPINNIFTNPKVIKNTIIDYV